MEINQSIFDDFGTFGDLVNRAREQLTGDLYNNHKRLKKEDKVKPRTRDLIR